MRALAISVCVAFLSAVACTAPNTTPSHGRTVEVWSGELPDFWSGDISPDGRFLSDINWDSGDLQLVDLSSGSARGVTGGGYHQGRYAWTSAFSTDGRRLAVSWYLFQAHSHELRVMNLDGTVSRVLVAADEEPAFVDPLDWSPSDEQILVGLRRADRRWQLALVSVDDGSVQVLTTLSWPAPGGGQAYPKAYFSPDGRYVGYDYRPNLEEHPRHIYALAVDGSGQTELVSGPGTSRFLGWIPDGRGILFYSDRNGTPGIWRLSVRDGRPVGEPEVVLPDVRGVDPLGFTRDGYAYGVVLEASRVHTAILDSETRRILIPPHPVDDEDSGASWAADWSPDGTRLAYVNHDRPTETLVIRSVDGDVIRAMPLSATLHTSSATFKWVSNDTIILFGMEKGRAGIYHMDPRDGSFSRLPERVTAGAGELKWFGVAPDARTLYFVLPSARAGMPRDIVARNVETGEQRVIETAFTDGRSLTISPDGEELAYIGRHIVDGGLELRVAPTSGMGDARVLYRAIQGHQIHSPVAWLPDGSQLIFVLSSADGDRGLWSVAADGTQEPIQLGGGDWCCAGHDIRIHPDGRRITLVAAGRQRGSVWILEGF